MNNPGEVLQSQSGLIRWYETVAGRHILSLENQLVAEGVQDLFGYHLASLGPLQYAEGIEASPITHKVAVNVLSLDKSAPELLADPEDLALLSDSVDVLVLPHMLEYSSQPHAMLREAKRVVHAHGHVVILGFNPLSCYGLCRVMPGLSGHMPWQGHFYHPIRLRDWLKLLGFGIVKTQYTVFTPPIQHQKSLHYLSCMESIRNTFIAPLGGVYMIVARNLAVTPNVLRPKWASRATLIKNGVVEPSGRVVNHRLAAKTRASSAR